MIKVDLITGFLGSGKTTFLKKYAQYWLRQGTRIAILENDFGAVNIDMLMLKELESDSCILEMVAGGCCARDHRRRFHTKLIALAMQGVERVMIEPSGIFDVDEFFDSLHEEPLDRWYEIGNVIAIVDAHLEEELPKKEEYLLASQIADAGTILISKADTSKGPMDTQRLYEHLTRALKQFRCTRKLRPEELNTSSWESWSEGDWKKLASSGYRLEDFIKLGMNMDHDYQTMYIMNHKMDEEAVRSLASRLFEDEACGRIYRMKGFFQTMGAAGDWMEFNGTAGQRNTAPIAEGQSVLIIIGDGLAEAKIKEQAGGLASGATFQLI